jgi:predicted DNA-binding transcriptional regulator AlpA
MPYDSPRTDDTASDERALAAREVAKFLGVAEITLSKWRARGEGPRFFRAGRRNVRYRLGDVIAWRAERTVGR